MLHIRHNSTRLVITTCLLFQASLFFKSAASHATPRPRAPKNTIERNVQALGVRGRLSIRPIDQGRFLISMKTAKGSSADTVRGSALIPLMQDGRKVPFYFGRFGSALLPMLIVGLEDPEIMQDSRVVAYEVSSSGSLIGQRVLVDETINHRHTDETSGGRYELAAIDPKLGAIYSIAYQEARFEGYYLNFEKLRVRQWEASIGSFIETDQGFLRDSNGRIVETSRFHMLNDPAREKIFAENVQPKIVRIPQSTDKGRIITASSKTATR